MPSNILLSYVLALVSRLVQSVKNFEKNNFTESFFAEASDNMVEQSNRGHNHPKRNKHD